MTRLILALVILVSLWKVFIKAGRPGWQALIPIYNLIVLFQIACRPVWQAVVLMLTGVAFRMLPLVGSPFMRLLVSLPLAGATFGLWLILSLGLAEEFDKSTGFGILTAFLPFVGFLELGFGGARYRREGSDTAELV